MLGAVFGIQIGAALRIVIELRTIVLEGQVYQCAIRSVKLYLDWSYLFSLLALLA